MKKASLAVLELEQLAEPTGNEASESAGTASPLLSRDLSLFGHVNVRVRVEVGHLDIAIEKLLACKAGDVLTMAQDVDAPVTLLVDDKPVARGQLVAVDDNFGVQITEII